MSDASPPAGPTPEEAAVRKLTGAMWLGLIAAFLGWMFDGLEMGLYSLVIRPALADLMHTDSERELALVTSVTISLFLTGMAAGGLIFGRLGDRIGRVKTLAIAILVYAIFTALSGATQNWQQLAACRFLGAMGLGGEWGLGVALVMESWPNASRPVLAGLLGAAANFGFLASGGIGWLKTYLNWGWREPLYCGAIPAAMLFLLRLGVKEPEKFVRSRERGETSRLRELFAPGFRRNTLIGSGLGAIAVLGMWGAYQTWLPMWAPRLAVPAMARVTEAYEAAKTARAAVAQGAPDAEAKVYAVFRPLAGAQQAAEEALRLNPSVGKDLTTVRNASYEAAKQFDKGGTIVRGRGDLSKASEAVLQAAEAARKAIKPVVSSVTAATMTWIAIGSIVGAMLGALIGDWIGRRWSFALLCVLSTLAACLLYLGTREYSGMFYVWAALAGVPITAFFGWLPLYLPELYPTRLRATGEGFCFNVGRIVSAAGVFGTSALVKAFGGIPFAAATMSLIYILGLPLIGAAPETKGQDLPE
jgi:MFS transporter, SHS family, sialic acid transporter